MLKTLANLLQKLLGLLKKVFVRRNKLNSPTCPHFNRTSWRLRKLPNEKSYLSRTIALLGYLCIIVEK